MSRHLTAVIDGTIRDTHDPARDGNRAVALARPVCDATGNADAARAMIRNLPALLGTDRAPCSQGCDTALEHALITAPEARDPAMIKKLDAVAGRVLSGSKT